MAAKTAEDRLLARVVNELDRIQEKILNHVRPGAEYTEEGRMHNATLTWVSGLIDTATDRIVRPYREEVMTGEGVE